MLELTSAGFQQAVHQRPRAIPPYGPHTDVHLHEDVRSGGLEPGYAEICAVPELRAEEQIQSSPNRLAKLKGVVDAGNDARCVVGRKHRSRSRHTDSKISCPRDSRGSRRLELGNSHGVGSIRRDQFDQPCGARNVDEERERERERDAPPQTPRGASQGFESSRRLGI